MANSTYLVKNSASCGKKRLRRHLLEGGCLFTNYEYHYKRSKKVIFDYSKLKEGKGDDICYIIYLFIYLFIYFIFFY